MDGRKGNGRKVVGYWVTIFIQRSEVGSDVATNGLRPMRVRIYYKPVRNMYVVLHDSLAVSHYLS